MMNYYNSDIQREGVFHMKSNNKYAENCWRIIHSRYAYWDAKPDIIRICQKSPRCLT